MIRDRPGLVVISTSQGLLISTRIMTQESSILIRSMRKRRSNQENEFAKPFFKWAGGKSQLLQDFYDRFPSELSSGTIDRYVEPFIGGGAVFFLVAQLFPLREAVICDVNEELILTYRVVQQDVEALISELKSYQERYDALDEAGRKEMYLGVRADLNASRSGFDYTEYGAAWIQRAGQLLFLNKTCFNGLFRVNSQGGFNVPFGKYKNPGIVHESNLRKVSALLAGTTILLGDFNCCREYVDARTFVYLDPPYRPLNQTSSFTSYSTDQFTEADQVRLSEFYALLDQTGAKVMLSNSDPKNEDPTDHFFDDLYQAYRIERVMAKRFINSDAEKRGAISEIIVMNYQPS
ncbi:MAG TPA: DNA adenine methylase [Methanospirillum sp.]|nr:DNA adenine methylase [Methanospirillum sp.]